MTDGRSPRDAWRLAAGDLVVVTAVVLVVLTGAGLAAVAVSAPTDPLHRALVDDGPAGLAVLLGALLLAGVPLGLRHARRSREQASRLAALRSQAEAARREERARIGADLHDTVVQDLAGIAFDLAAAAAEVDDLDRDETRTTLLGGADACREGITTLRALLVDLAPDEPPAVDLARALPDLAADLKGRGVRVDVQVAPLAAVQVGRDVQALLYRAAQEGVRNVARHAAATRATISLTTREGRATLLVEDDGHGMSSRDLVRQRAAGHLGLTLLADRVHAHSGELTISSEPGRGTRLTVCVPVAPDRTT